MIDSLTTVAVVVSNAKKAAAWYQQTLGFEIRDDEGHWVTVAPPRSGVLLHLCKQAKLEPGNTGIAFAAEDLKGTCQELEKKGVKFHRRYTEADWGSFAMFKDPDGNVFWLVPA